MADMPDDPSPPNDFEARLRAAQTRERDEKKGNGRSGGSAANTGIGLGFRLATELVAATVVGTLIGYGLDRWLGTRPWLMIVFVLLGSVSGIMNAYRAAKAYDSAHNARRDP